jgi:outer membrane protein
MRHAIIRGRRTDYPWIALALLFGILAGHPRLSSAQEPPSDFTLPTAIQHALNNSTRMLSAAEGVEAAQANKKKQFTEFLPKLSAGYTFRHADAETSLDSFVISSQDLHEFTATARQPIFSGFSRLTQYDISALGLDIAQLIEQETRQDLILDVKTAYFEVLQKEKLEEVAKQAVTQLQAQCKVSKNFYEVGMVPKNDFLQAQVELANAQQDLVVAQNNVQLARSRFNTILRRPVDAVFTLEDVLIYEVFTRTYEECVALAMEQRTEMKVADLEVETAEKEVKLTKSDYFPSIDLLANYYKRGDNFELDGGEGILKDEEWDVMAVASWTFFEWGKTRYGTQEKVRRVNQARLNRVSVEDDIRQQVKGAYLTVKAAENAVITVEKAVEQAKENYRMNQERYKEQVATSTDVLIAQTLLTRTQNNFYNALSAFNVAKAGLHRAIGLEVLSEP